MPRVSLTRVYRFPASHRLHSELLSARENREVYGKCNNPFGHGHDYTLEVTAAGEVEESTGVLTPLETLDRLVRAAVIEPFSHRHLNVEVEEFATLVPTTENLALVAARRLSRAWGLVYPAGGPVLERVKIHETARNVFELPLAPREALAPAAAGAAQRALDRKRPQ
jgi:6-pyruvoyltetrahydropterin/6-carboxytetrahydropterin synthase